MTRKVNYSISVDKEKPLSPKKWFFWKYYKPLSLEISQLKEDIWYL